ncbi:MAG TPA: DUF4344 domain-containing metallopeptidase [Pyrinomonadaceae bacterium]|nr:DUF4344 domain-containing metallopeptidase [Pyrinomonadaceae bacterium]
MISNRAYAGRTHITWALIPCLVIPALLTLSLPALAQNSLLHESRQPASTSTTISRGTIALSQIAGLASGPSKYKLLYLAHPRPTRSRDTSRIARNERVILNTIQELNEQLTLPFDVNISLETCGEPNASYNHDNRQVTICYEMVDVFYSLFSRTMKRGTKLNEAVEGAMLSLFLHEVGHALVDACDLPVTGREEDAVDQLSTLILINSRISRERMALNGARVFRILANMERHESKFFWDEHSTFAQRYYDTICLIYGHDPDKYEYLVSSKQLPEERAAKCGAEYQRVKNAWSQLLEPYTKQSLNIH